MSLPNGVRNLPRHKMTFASCSSAPLVLEAGKGGGVVPLLFRLPFPIVTLLNVCYASRAGSGLDVLLRIVVEEILEGFTPEVIKNADKTKAVVRGGRQMEVWCPEAGGLVVKTVYVYILVAAADLPGQVQVAGLPSHSCE